MTEFIQSATTWGLHAAVAGAVVFALGWAWVRRTASPARRRELAAWVVRGGLLVAVLCVFPAWLLLPFPQWGASRPATPEPIPDRPLPPEAARPLSSPVVVAPADFLGERGGVSPPVPDLGEQGVVTFLVPDAVGDKGERGGLSQPVNVADRTQNRGAYAAPLAFEQERELGVAPLVLLAYGAGVSVAAFPLVLGVVALVRLRRSGVPAPAAVQAVFDELAAGCRVRLLVSTRISSPLCFGLFRPVVVIPKMLANTATDAELRWVFGHELDHLRRGDPWAGWWVAVARAVYFFVPWFWRVRRELVLAQEQLADAAAVAAGGRGEDYAAFWFGYPAARPGGVTPWGRRACGRASRTFSGG